MKDTFEKFSLTTVSLHWIIAIGMIAMIGFGLFIEDMPRSPEKGELIGLHKSFGILILLLAIVRIAWRVENKFPKPLSAMPGWQEKLAQLIHWVLIIGTVLMPVSGALMSIGGGHPIAVFGLELVAGSEQKIEILSDIGSALHGLGGNLLILFITLHFVGAIKHQVMDKDGTMQRMFGKRVMVDRHKA